MKGVSRLWFSEYIIAPHLSPLSCSNDKNYNPRNTTFGKLQVPLITKWEGLEKVRLTRELRPKLIYLFEIYLEINLCISERCLQDGVETLDISHLL